MPASLTLTRKGTDPAELPGGLQQHNWLLIVEARGNLIPSEIFVWHAAVINDAVPGDRFEAVASVHQLEAVPTEFRRPQKGGQLCPYYRTRRLELFCRNAEEADRVWTSLQADAKQLVNNWNLKDNLITLGSADTDGETTTVEETDTTTPEEDPVNISDFVFDEPLNGLVDGDNKVFSIDNPAAPNTLQVFRNGIRVYGEGEDYEQAGQLVTFSVAPSEGSRMTANYILAP